MNLALNFSGRKFLILFGAQIVVYSSASQMEKDLFCSKVYLAQKSQT
jgi:hypothetical protein